MHANLKYIFLFLMMIFCLREKIWIAMLYVRLWIMRSTKKAHLPFNTGTIKEQEKYLSPDVAINAKDPNIPFNSFQN